MTADGFLDFYLIFWLGGGSRNQGGTGCDSRGTSCVSGGAAWIYEAAFLENGRRGGYFDIV